MKPLLMVLIWAVTSSTSFGQHSLQKLWESDSVTLKGPESALFDPITKSLYISSMNSGSVVRMDLTGKVIQKDWVTGLNSNKGSAIFKGKFYTAEIAGIAIIDIRKGFIEKRIPVEGAVMLNDLAVDSKGFIYVSDSRTGKVYRVENDKPVIYLENMPGANGLLTVGSDLYLLTSTSVQKISETKEITKIADEFESGLDGIVMPVENEFVLSNYKGILYYLKADGTKQVLLDSRSLDIMSNDISYDPATKTIYAPAFSGNRIIAYKLN